MCSTHFPSSNISISNLVFDPLLFGQFQAFFRVSLATAFWPPSTVVKSRCGKLLGDVDDLKGIQPECMLKFAATPSDASSTARDRCIRLPPSSGFPALTASEVFPAIVRYAVCSQF